MSEVPKGPGFGMTFLYYFSVTALITAFLTTRGLHIDMETGIPNQLGLITGSLAGLLGGYFNRSVLLELPITNRKSFIKQLNQVLADMGYELSDTLEDDVMVYQRSALRQLFSGQIYIQITPKQAVLSSRSTQIKQIQKRLERSSS